MAISSIPLILKIGAWPKADQKLWQACQTRGGLFDECGAFAGWANGTCRLHQQGYGSWLSFISRRHPELVHKPPIERVTRATVTSFIEEGRERLQLRSISNQLLSLATTMRGFAPDADIKWLWRAVEKLYRQSDPHKLKPPLTVSAHHLFAWSLDRLRSAQSCAQLDRLSIATEFRQALTVGLLIGCPVRARAFVAMTVSRHIDVSGGYITLTFSPDDMKDKKARQLPVPQLLTPFLLEYLKIHRPVLLGGQASDAVWISRRGKPLTQDSFTSGLALLTKRNFGVVLRPHAFRHVAATSIAIADPAHAGIIRDVLGHASVRMAEAHYNRATARDASKRLQDILRDKRKQRRRKRRKDSNVVGQTPS